MTDRFVLTPPLIGNFVVTQTFAEHVARGLPHYNGGIDYGCPTGTPVYAAADGTVIESDDDPGGYGTYIKVSHPGNYLTIYGHLAMRFVPPGMDVKRCQMIGRSDNTGNSTGPHLHFEFRKDGVPTDPELYFEEPQPQPVPQPGPGFPSLARVLASRLHVRSLPDTSDAGNILGWMPEGLVVQAFGTRDVAGDTWLDLGQGMYAAMTYGGNKFMEWA